VSTGDIAQKLGRLGPHTLSEHPTSCHKARKMTNRIALYIGLAIVVILVLDYALGLGLALFLARRFLDLISLVAIWR
jgi:hypothetical protein